MNNFDALPENSSNLQSNTNANAPNLTNNNLAPLHNEVEMENRLKNGASWFYWIGGLSLINSISAYTGSHWGFSIGLGITQIADGIALALADKGFAMGKLFSLGFDIFVVAIFITLGYFAARRTGFCFILGLIFYGIDAIITLLLGIWLSLALHIFALVQIFVGYRACKSLLAMQKVESSMAINPQP